MQPTYSIVGGDGETYGPVSMEDLKSWIEEGRVAAETTILRSDRTDWAPASEFPELGLASESAPDDDEIEEESAPTPAAHVPISMVRTPAPAAPTPAPTARTPVPAIPTPASTVRSSAPATATPTPAARTSAPAARPATPTASAPDPAVTSDSTALEKKIKNGASWFYVIGFLSLINSFAFLMNAQFNFIVGLGITQVIDGMAKNMGPNGTTIGLVLDAAAAGLFLILGICAIRKQAWAFILGMILYLGDGVLFFLVQDWIGVAFHVFVVLCLLGGLLPTLQWKKLQRGES